MVSSEYRGDLVRVKTRSGGKVKKPKIIDKYNLYRNRIDHADRFTAYYVCDRKKIQWYVKAGLHTFHVIMNNAYLLHRIHTGTKIM